MNMKTNTKKIAFCAYFSKLNKGSISVLISTIEKDFYYQNTDIFIYKDFSQLLNDAFHLSKEFEKVVIAFSFTTPNYLEIKSKIDLLSQLRTKNNLRNLVFVAGGPHASGNFSDTLEIGFDIAFIGEAEESFPEYMKNIILKKPIDDIANIAFLRDKNIIHYNKSKHLINLDDYPAFSKRDGLLGPIEISRGCPFKCKYCQTSFLMGDKMRHRSIDNIIFWTKEIKQRRKNDIRFVTPNALAYGSDGKNINLDAIEKLLISLNEIAGKEHIFFGSFPSEVRPEFITKESVNLIKYLTANKRIIIGAQSGSQRMLDLANRGHSVDDILKSVDITLNAGLSPHLDFIFGMPDETKSDRRQTIDLIDKLVSKGAIIHSHFFMPLEGSPWGDKIPSDIDDDTKNMLSKLSGFGKQYGQWKKQMNDAKLICYMRKKYIIEKNISAF